MRRSKRLSKKRVDYASLNSTGEKKLIAQGTTAFGENQINSEQIQLENLFSNLFISEESVIHVEMNKQVEKLGVQESSIADDILDFIDENPVQDFGSSISDLDARTCKMESFRRSY